MNLIVHGLDKGAKPARFVEHMYQRDGSNLLHFTDGELRATVPPAGFVDFAVDHPESAALTGVSSTQISEAKLARATRHAAIAQRARPSTDQASISDVVDRAVTAALERFKAEQGAKAPDPAGAQ